jgi:uncharacterized protein YndB with AHSA1/START domain
MHDKEEAMSSLQVNPDSSVDTLITTGRLTLQDDMTRRSVEIHWPEGDTPADADLFAHNEIIIDAPPEKVWEHLVAAAAWPQWYSNSADVVVNDPSELLGPDVSFDWSTFGLQISSTVAEFVPPFRLGWYGTGEGLHAYHTWLLVPHERSTYVVMEEIGRGDGAKQLARTNPGHMHRGHDLWNISLKFLCEA